MKRKWVIIMLVWLGLMFFLSHQNGQDTFNTSHGMTVMLANFLHVDAVWLHGIVRKSAHVILYMILAAIVAAGCRESRRGWLWLVLPVVISLLDEGTKPLIPGRHCDIEDILLNDLGAILGFVVLRLGMGRQSLELKN